MPWLDHMPPIPLARGVPVVVVHDTHPGRNFRALPLHAFNGRWTLHDGSGLDGSGLALVAESSIRVDLDDPQGFGYALRWLHMRMSQIAECDLEAMPAVAALLVGDALEVVRHLVDETTDADRETLARAIGEVSRG